MTFERNTSTFNIDIYLLSLFKPPAQLLSSTADNQMRIQGLYPVLRVSARIEKLPLLATRLGLLQTEHGRVRYQRSSGGRTRDPHFDLKLCLQATSSVPPLQKFRFQPTFRGKLEVARQPHNPHEALKRTRTATSKVQLEYIAALQCHDICSLLRFQHRKGLT